MELYCRNNVFSLSYPIPFSPSSPSNSTLSNPQFDKFKNSSIGSADRLAMAEKLPMGLPCKSIFFSWEHPKPLGVKLDRELKAR